MTYNASEKYLFVEIAILMANGMISSRLDYCYSLLHGVDRASIAKLQEVENDLCCIVYRLDNMGYITPFLENIHWLFHTVFF